MDHFVRTVNLPCTVIKKEECLEIGSKIIELSTLKYSEIFNTVNIFMKVIVIQ